MQFSEKAVASALRRLRRERGLSQEVLSGLAGMARTHLTMMENGEMLPSLRTLWRIAAALDMKPSQLVAEIEAAAQEAENCAVQGR